MLKKEGTGCIFLAISELGRGTSSSSQLLVVAFRNVMLAERGDLVESHGSNFKDDASRGQGIGKVEIPVGADGYTAAKQDFISAQD